MKHILQVREHIGGESAWDRMSRPAKAATVIFGALYFVALPLATVAALVAS